MSVDDEKQTSRPFACRYYKEMVNPLRLRQNKCFEIFGVDINQHKTAAVARKI